MRHAILIVMLSLAMPALAKLPPPTPEEVAAAEAKKAKADEAAKQAAQLLAKAQDRAVENYKRNQQAGGAAPMNTSTSSMQSQPAP